MVPSLLLVVRYHLLLLCYFKFLVCDSISVFHFCGVCCFLTVSICLFCYFGKSLFVDTLYSSNDKLWHVCSAELQTLLDSVCKFDFSSEVSCCICYGRMDISEYLTGQVSAWFWMNLMLINLSVTWTSGKKGDKHVVLWQCLSCMN
jgi:hypothetical protein